MNRVQNSLSVSLHKVKTIGDLMTLKTQVIVILKESLYVVESFAL